MTGTKVDTITEETDQHKEHVKAMNTYTTKKTFAQGLMDIGLLMANASQLKAMVSAGPSIDYYWSNIVMISLSILLQIIVGVMLLVTASMKVKTKKETRSVHVLNDVTTGLIFVITVLNVFIGAFGIKLTN